MKIKILSNFYILGALSLVLTCYGCSKYLDAKPDKTLEIPSSLNDLQALLDYYPRMNTRDPGSPIISADNYYLTDESYNFISEKERRMYTWQKDFLFENSFNDWSNIYNAVYYANTVLEDIGKIAKTSQNLKEWNDIKGQAYFFRAKSFLQAVWIWSDAYDSATANNDLGIPLRLNTDFNTPSIRSTLQQTYDQIINDLRNACTLLTVRPVNVMRPSKPAAYALMARTFLSMGNYNYAGLYADSCLQLYNTLLDYNTLNPNSSFPISQFNQEVIFESSVPCPTPLVNSIARIDTILYKSYQPNDLRKKIFFQQVKDHSYAFKGSYEGSINLFSGIATDEVLLMKAECQARVGDVDGALTSLNILLKARYEPGFKKINENDPEKLLGIILLERRKELLMRGLRWMDIKRFNQEGVNIELKRIVAGDTYTLQPNDLRYALPIPEDIIKLSGMKQNPR